MLTPYQVYVVSAVSDTVSALSIIGSLFIVVCFTLFPTLRSFSFKLVLSLAITDLFNQLAGYIGPTDTDMADMNIGKLPVSSICYFQSITESYFNLASIFWATTIAYTLYRIVVQRALQQTPYLYAMYAAACWGIPVVLTALPATDVAYGPAGGWCWIVDNKAYWRFIQFYVPLWIIAISITYMYIRVILALREIVERNQADQTWSTAKDMIARLKWYPFILFVVWFWASVNRIYETAMPGYELFWLVLMQRMFSNCQGLLNAFAYGVGSPVREAIWNGLPHRLKMALRCLNPHHVFDTPSGGDSAITHISVVSVSVD